MGYGDTVKVATGCGKRILLPQATVSSTSTYKFLSNILYQERMKSKACMVFTDYDIKSTSTGISITVVTSYPESLFPLTCGQETNDG